MIEERKFRVIVLLVTLREKYLEAGPHYFY